MIMNYVRKRDYEAVQLDGEWVVLNADNYTVTKLNGTGGYCWSLLREVQSVDMLLQAIRSEYEWVSEGAQQELEAFLSELVECGLVEHASQ